MSVHIEVRYIMLRYTIACDIMCYHIIYILGPSIAQYVISYHTGVCETTNIYPENHTHWNVWFQNTKSEAG